MLSMSNTDLLRKLLYLTSSKDPKIAMSLIQFQKTHETFYIVNQQRTTLKELTDYVAYEKDKFDAGNFKTPFL